MPTGTCLCGRCRCRCERLLVSGWGKPRAGAPRATRLLRSFFGVVVRDHFHGVAPDREGELLVGFRNEAYSRGSTLPARRRALCVFVVGGFAQGLFQDGLAASQLHHYGGELAAIVRDSTIGNVVAVPGA